jgi:hypothetical protein
MKIKFKIIPKSIPGTVSLFGILCVFKSTPPPTHANTTAAVFKKIPLVIFLFLPSLPLSTIS